jgi:tRNA 5-methylaminomethyl-2-thiouridine biosynthesis bifunctional protein
MVGNVPDYDATLTYATLAEHKTQAPTAPVYRNLFMLGRWVRAGCAPRR